MRELIKYLVYSLLLFLIFLPILNLFLSTFLPNFRLTDPSSFLDFIIFSFDQRVIQIFFRTLLIGFFTSLLCGMIGLILAVLLEFSDILHKKIFRFLLFTPFLIPTYLSTFSWLAFLGKRGTYSSLVFPNLPIDIYNPVTLVIFLSLSFFPISMFVISLGLKNLDRNLIDAARLSKNKRTLRKIVMPLVKPHILIACFFVFVLSISEYTVPSFLRVNTYSDEIFAQLAAFYNLRRATVYSFPLILLALGVSGLFYFYSKKKSFVTISTFSRQKKDFIKLSKFQKFLSYSFIFLLVLFSLLVPIFMLIIESGPIFKSIVFAKESIFNSFWSGVLSSFIITIFGFFTYYFLRENPLLTGLISFPLSIASPVLGIAMINLYNNLPVPVYGTILMIVFGYVLRFLPFSVFTFSAFFPQVSPSLEESARISGSGFLKTLQKIIIPLTKAGFISSFIIVFIFCLGEIGVTQMISPPGFQTLPMRIETLMHYGNYPYVASLSLLLLTFIFVFYIIYLKVYGKDD